MRIDLPEILGGPDTESTLAMSISEKFMAQNVAYYGDEQEPLRSVEGSLEFLLEYPGRVRVPSFQGQQVGKYSRKQRRIQVCCAVPIDLLNSAAFAEFFITNLETAIAVAKKRFDLDGIPFDLDRHLGFVESLRMLDLNTAKALPWVEKLRGARTSDRIE